MKSVTFYFLPPQLHPPPPLPWTGPIVLTLAYSAPLPSDPSLVGSQPQISLVLCKILCPLSPNEEGCANPINRFLWPFHWTGLDLKEFLFASCIQSFSEALGRSRNLRVNTSSQPSDQLLCELKRLFCLSLAPREGKYQLASKSFKKI